MNIFGNIVLLSLISICLAQWTSNNFPNPKTDSRGCKNSGVAQICDPDSILSQSNRASLARRLTEVTRSTQGIYKGDVCAQKGLTIYSALTNRIQSASGGAKASETDQQAFAEGLRNKWQPDPQCSKGLVITVSKSDRTFWTAREKNNPISDQKLKEFFQRHKSYFGSNLFLGLLSLVNDIERAYQNLGRSGSGTYGSDSRGSSSSGSKTNYDRNNKQGGNNKKKESGGSNISGGDAAKFLKKIPGFAWAILAVVILSCLCCGCICYCCCCRKKGGAASGQTTSAGGSGGAGGLLRGAGIGAILSQCLPRIMGALQNRGGGGNRRGGYEMGQRDTDPPPPYTKNTTDGGGGAGGSWGGGGPAQPMYPQLPKDEGKGAGGSW